MKRVLISLGAAAAALTGCAPAFAPPERMTLACTVERSFRINGRTELEDATTRILWVDVAQGLYALSEFGERGPSAAVDPDWAQAFQEERAQHGGLAPIARRSGAFLCFVAGEDFLCRHGVDLERGDYAFWTDAAGPAETGSPGKAQVRGVGRCAPAPDVSWPAEGPRG